MIVHQCDWCGAQTPNRMQNTWQRVKITRANECEDTYLDVIVCEECAIALQAFVAGRKAL